MQLVFAFFIFGDFMSSTPLSFLIDAFRCEQWFWAVGIRELDGVLSSFHDEACDDDGLVGLGWDSAKIFTDAWILVK